MSESGSSEKVFVTAQERAHPALRKLARACIALARMQVSESSEQRPVSPPPATAAAKEATANAEEQANG